MAKGEPATRTVHTIDGYTADESLYGYFQQNGQTKGERIRLTKEEYHGQKEKK